MRHARDLGVSLDAIRALIELQSHPDQSCDQANDIAQEQLADVRARIARLRSLEQELDRIVSGCSGEGVAGNCYVLASLADHALCGGEHRA
jgi:DNA-binding transcriptional MerR regulator